MKVSIEKNLMNSFSNCWQITEESYDMIYNEELIRVKLCHKTQPAHWGRRRKRETREMKLIKRHCI